MKNLIALLLVAVMCLSLVACGSGETPNTNDNNGTEQFGSESTNNNENESTQPDNSSALLPYMCGEWKVLNIKDEGVLESVIFTEDGNINIDGSSYKLSLQSEDEDSAYFEIIDGEAVAGNLYFHIEDNGELTLFLQHFTDTEIALYKPDHYEIITVTTDNVYEYFELRDFWTESTNAFGELTSVRIDTRLVLKEQYYSRLSQRLMDGSSETVVENGAIEWHYKRSGLDVVVNLDDKTYTFENFESGTEDTATGVQGFACNDEYAGFWARFLQLTPDSEGRHTYTWACAYEIEITRLELDLYLIAETN